MAFLIIFLVPIGGPLQIIKSSPKIRRSEGVKNRSDPAKTSSKTHNPDKEIWELEIPKHRRLCCTGGNTAGQLGMIRRVSLPTCHIASSSLASSSTQVLCEDTLQELGTYPRLRLRRSHKSLSSIAGNDYAAACEDRALVRQMAVAFHLLKFKFRSIDQSPDHTGGVPVYRYFEFPNGLRFGQGNGQILVSKTHFCGQPFGGASRGLLLSARDDPPSDAIIIRTATAGNAAGERNNEVLICQSWQCWRHSPVLVTSHQDVSDHVSGRAKRDQISLVSATDLPDMVY
ncbi:hypothetical protein B0H19DRAFT_1234048 [Mycena capillaripes]|nr:hypothetical protein B0H19DRAFT_1234048 [Mycena capillaripes]